MNKKRLIIALIVSVVIIATSIAVIFIIKNNDEEINNNEVIDHSVKVTGKLQEYISNLTDNYYIKYSGKFKNNLGEYTNAVIEYTKDGENFAFRSSEINMYLICEKETLYNVSHKYKIIIKMGKQSINTSEYNLVSNIGQTYIKTYKENVGSRQYDVEEYLYNGNIIKYYFKEKDIKLIRYNNQDIRIVRLDRKTNAELLVKPSGYSFAIQ